MRNSEPRAGVARNLGRPIGRYWLMLLSLSLLLLSLLFATARIGLDDWTDAAARKVRPRRVSGKHDEFATLSRRSVSRVGFARGRLPPLRPNDPLSVAQTFRFRDKREKAETEGARGAKLPPECQRISTSKSQCRKSYVNYICSPPESRNKTFCTQLLG